MAHGPISPVKNVADLKALRWLCERMAVFILDE